MGHPAFVAGERGRGLRIRFAMLTLRKNYCWERKVIRGETDDTCGDLGRWACSQSPAMGAGKRLRTSASEGWRQMGAAVRSPLSDDIRCAGAAAGSFVLEARGTGIQAQ
jgi:hypothetical protein